jgi:membrane peptidoglycan carboxypeptidase
MLAWYGRRRRAKKRRLAKMSRGRRVLRRVGITGTWLLALITTMLVTVVVLFYALSDVPRPEALPLPQVATIQYSDGSVMARIGTEDRTIVPLAQVPEPVRWDVLAAEDRNFYSEPGFSVKGTLRAAVSDITGGDTQGGSGITQQYVKNAYLSDARTLSRKLKELMIAVKLSRDYAKDQILEFYLNTVYFGRGVYGIQAAADSFFGLDVSKLSVAQGAVLAALLRDPGYYDPTANPEAAKTRWRFVIAGMVSTHHLTQAQADALSYPKVLAPKPTQLGAVGPTALIVQQVKYDLEAHGITEAEINTRGLSIRTTIDKNAQVKAQDAVSQTFGNLTAKQKNFKNALVAIDPASGAVVAYYGGSGPQRRGYNGKVDYNDYAGIGTRPPGSSFKPYTLATVLTQTVKKSKGRPPLTISSQVDGSFCVTIQARKICNDPGDLGVSGSSVSIANAMKYSLNTTFDLLAQQAGPANVAAIAHATGIAKTDSSGNPSLANSKGQTGFGIGIGDYPVSPLDQAVGFSTFANNGVRNDPYFVQQATDSSGTVVYQHVKAPKRVLDARVANDVTLTMQPVASWSGDALAGGRVSAAKTGTEGIYNDPAGNNSDAWMVGYTPQVSVAVWAGSGNSTTPIYNADGRPEYGADLPGRTWQAFMDAYLAGQAALPMATTQLVTDGTAAVAPSASATPTPSRTAATSSAPKPSPTFSLKTTFAAPSTAVVTSRPPPDSSSPPATSSSSCVPGLLHLCP